jgi:hypothetical protein
MNFERTCSLASLLASVAEAVGRNVRSATLAITHGGNQVAERAAMVGIPQPQDELFRRKSKMVCISRLDNGSEYCRVGIYLVVAIVPVRRGIRV